MRAPAALLLALLTLAGSLGLSVNRHWCEGELVSIAFFGAKAETCDRHNSAEPVCPHHPATTDEEKDENNCCDDEQTRYEVDNQQQVDGPQLPALTLVQANFGNPSLPEVAPLHPRPRKKNKLERYRPPPLVIDVPSHWQVFRI